MQITSVRVTCCALILATPLLLSAGSPSQAANMAAGSSAPTANTIKTKITSIIDGDTVETAIGTVRLLGIDTPEIGECGYEPASSMLASMAPVGSTVKLSTSKGHTTDRYGRFLRYVSIGGTDVGGQLIISGLADARYDSRDGYGKHSKESKYVKWDAAYPDAYEHGPCSAPEPSQTTTPPVDSSPSLPSTPGLPAVYFENCTAVRLAGAAPIHLGDPGYGRHLDRDGDGTACE